MSDELNQLRKEVLANIEKNRSAHDAAVLMGSLGVSPSHFLAYQESIRKIDEQADIFNSLMKAKRDE